MGAGSIPACAGEPVRRYAGGRHGGVYPRVCGGAFRLMAVAFWGPGLSPRVRGSPVDAGPDHPGRGSIPACAGEPSPSARDVLTIRVYPRVCGEPAISSHNWRMPRVYPRVCGGASLMTIGRSSASGLSPRVRGSRFLAAGKPNTRGSIPACAGEPRNHSSPSPGSGVYPRVCGGAT